MKISAFCNKCGWMGEVEPGLGIIFHDKPNGGHQCSYTACYSPTGLKMHALYEALKDLYIAAYDDGTLSVDLGQRVASVLKAASPDSRGEEAAPDASE